MPSLSVVVCTRNRGALVLPTVRSVLAASAADHEVLILDQSDDRLVEDALSTVDGMGRVRYVRTETRGLSAARNVGLRVAQSPIVVMTDDDCVVDEAWVTSLERAFHSHPGVALVFGNVRPATIDRNEGFIPAYERTRASLAVGLTQKTSVEGVGACMAVRRDVAIALGGFDEMLGAGAPYRAGEEVDLTLRVLAAGHAVCATPDACVTHHGVRAWASRRELVRDYWFGAGAAFGKLLQRRPVPAVGLLVKLAWRFVTAPTPMSQSFRLRRLSGTQVASFLRGLGTGAWTAVKTPGVPKAENALLPFGTPGVIDQPAADRPRGARRSPAPSRTRS